jgi:hypothetical protein
MAQLGLIRTSQPVPASGFAGAQGESLMKKTLTASLRLRHGKCNRTHADSADARCDGCAIGAGVVGGLVAGALIGGAVAKARPAPVYVEPAPVYAVPGAHLPRRTAGVVAALPGMGDAAGSRRLLSGDRDPVFRDRADGFVSPTNRDPR